MATPSDNPETDSSIINETTDDADANFRRYLQNTLVLRDIARRISEGVDPEEAVRQAKAVAEGKPDE
jgi:hypothetical protein